MDKKQSAASDDQIAEVGNISWDEVLGTEVFDRLVDEIFLFAGYDGLTEPEFDSAMKSFNQHLAVACLVRLWQEGQCCVRWDREQGLAFVAREHLPRVHPQGS